MAVDPPKYGVVLIQTWKTRSSVPYFSMWWDLIKTSKIFHVFARMKINTNWNMDFLTQRPFLRVKSAVSPTSILFTSFSFLWNPMVSHWNPIFVLVEFHSFLLQFLCFFQCNSHFNPIWEVSWNRGTPKSPILMVFSILNHPAIGGTSMDWKAPKSPNPIQIRREVRHAWSPHAVH